jgi:sugar lactone lactonase YvrE
VTTSAPAQLAVRATAAVGEGPLWDPETRQLHWVDIDSGAVHHSNLDTGADDQDVYGNNVSALALAGDGSLVAAMRRGYARLGRPPGRRELRDVQAVLPDGHRMNDAKCGPDGRFYAGGLRTDFAPGAGTLWRWDGSGPPVKMRAGLSQPNGLAWSPAGDTFYLCDTVQQVVTASRFDPDTGHLGPPEPLITFTSADGEADGLCADADGCLWIAFWGGAEVRRYDPRGRQIARVPVPVSQPSCPAFADGSRLVITSARAGLSSAELAREPLAGSVFEADAGVAGVPIGRFGANAGANLAADLGGDR